VAVSYNQALLFETISLHLHRNPSTSLGDLSGQLRVSRRTIQTVIIVKTGKGFTNLRKEMLLAKVRNLFMSQPAWAIKEVSFAVGYRSARSFARAIKRACGSSPEELRSHAAWGDTSDSLECQVATIHPTQ
jgi:AraC-like DNA-binding protein